MADIYGSHFEYGGVSSRQYNLIIANIDTKRLTTLSGNREGITIFSKREKKNYLIGDDYTKSPLSFDIEIVTEDGRRLEPVERRQIERWLFGKRVYRKLYFDVADDEFAETYEYIDGKCLRCYLNCRFNNPEKIEYQDGVVGYKATIEADSDMFWQDETVKLYSVNNKTTSSSSIVTVDVDTDLDEYIYPKVTIEMGSTGGDIIIANNSDDSTRFTKFTDIGAYATLIMKGELNYISGEYYEKFEKRNFIRLLNGENKLMVMGNIASITISYSARRIM